MQLHIKAKQDPKTKKYVGQVVEIKLKGRNRLYFQTPVDYPSAKDAVNAARSKYPTATVLPLH
jgi:hypothetical protein